VCARCCGSGLRGWPRVPALPGPGLKFKGPPAAGVGASTRRRLAAWVDRLGRRTFSGRRRRLARWAHQGCGRPRCRVGPAWRS
jgi:hypothetical protein